MLETPSIRRYSFTSVSSENPSGADNQQETELRLGILRDCTPGAVTFTAKRQSDPHGDMRSQAEMT
jgi:hypothetical protein